MSESGSERTRLPLWKRAMFGLVVVTVLLLVTEGALALFGVQPRPAAAFVGFSSSFDHYVVDDAGMVRRAPEDAHAVNEVAFPAKKPDGTYRIICFGGSTTYGRPFFANSSFGAWLQAYLDNADPSKDWEVINAGGIGYASYRVTGVMRELTDVDADLFVVYTGHNEYLERRTYEDVFDVPPVVREAVVFASSTRTGGAVATLFGAGEDSGPIGIDDSVQGIALDAVGPEAYTRDDAWSERVVTEFERALHGMVDIAEEAGARILFVTPVCNLDAFEPFKSEFGDGVSDEDAARIRRQIRKSVTTPGAAEALAALLEVDNRHAGLYYALGHALHDPKSSARMFERAVDEDIVPLRAKQDIVDVVRRVARERDTMLVDIRGVPGERVGITDMLGDRWFVDHVHLTQRGTQSVGQSIYGAMVRHGIVETGLTSLALEPLVKRAVKAAIDPREHGRELLKLTFVLNAIGRGESAVRQIEDALAMSGGDADLTQSAAESFALLGRHDRAMELLESLLAADPGRAGTLTALGEMHMKRGEVDLGVERFRQALEIDPSIAAAHSALGVFHATKREFDDAERHLRAALEHAPELAESHGNLGLLHARLDDYAEAIALYDAAIRRSPRDTTWRMNRALAQIGARDVAGARETLRELLEIAPNHADARARLDALTAGE